jgi:hypothetical protein
MKIWTMSQISDKEKSDILSKHRELYDGYRTLQPKPNNEIPLYVQDFANDKNGMVVNNRGDVKRYTNTKINEEVCEQCEMEEEDETGDLYDIYDISDLDKESKFDYVEDEIEEQDISGVGSMYSDMTPAYDYDSLGPGRGGPYQTFSTPTGNSKNKEYYKEFKTIKEELERFKQMIVRKK